MSPYIRVNREHEEAQAMKQIRIEKPKPRRPLEIELPPRLDPRDPDVVRVKQGPIWRFADRGWAQ